MKIIYFFHQRHAGSGKSCEDNLCASNFYLLNCRRKLLRQQVLKTSSFYSRIIPLFILLLSATFLSFPSLAEDISVNRLLASQCAQCHGPNGNAVDDMEKLTDESTKDLLEDLRDMQQEDSPDDIMDHQALGYTQDQIRRIAEYYGSLSGKNGDDDDDRDDDNDEDDDDDDDDHDDDEKHK